MSNSRKLERYADALDRICEMVGYRDGESACDAVERALDEGRLVASRKEEQALVCPDCGPSEPVSITMRRCMGCGAYLPR